MFVCHCVVYWFACVFRSHGFKLVSLSLMTNYTRTDASNNIPVFCLFAGIKIENIYLLTFVFVLARACVLYASSRTRVCLCVLCVCKIIMSEKKERETIQISI